VPFLITFLPIPPLSRANGETGFMPWTDHSKPFKINMNKWMDAGIAIEQEIGVASSVLDGIRTATEDL